MFCTEWESHCQIQVMKLLNVYVMLLRCAVPFSNPLNNDNIITDMCCSVRESHCQIQVIKLLNACVMLLRCVVPYSNSPRNDYILTDKRVTMNLKRRTSPSRNKHQSTHQ